MSASGSPRISPFARSFHWYWMAVGPFSGDVVTGCPGGDHVTGQPMAHEGIKNLPPVLAAELLREHLVDGVHVAGAVAQQDYRVLRTGMGVNWMIA